MIFIALFWCIRGLFICCLHSFGDMLFGWLASKMARMVWALLGLRGGATIRAYTNKAPRITKISRFEMGTYPLYSLFFNEFFRLCKIFIMFSMVFCHSCGFWRDYYLPSRLLLQQVVKATHVVDQIRKFPTFS